MCHRGFLMLSSSSYYIQCLLYSVNVYFHIWCLGTSCSRVWTRKTLLHLLVVMVLLSVVWAHFQYQGCIAQGDQLRYIVSQDYKSYNQEGMISKQATISQIKQNWCRCPKRNQWITYSHSIIKGSQVRKGSWLARVKGGAETDHLDRTQHWKELTCCSLQSDLVSILHTKAI